MTRPPQLAEAVLAELIADPRLLGHPKFAEELLAFLQEQKGAAR